MHVNVSNQNPMTAGAEGKAYVWTTSGGDETRQAITELTSWDELAGTFKWLDASVTCQVKDGELVFGICTENGYYARLSNVALTWLGKTPTGIEIMNTDVFDENAPTYNIAGMRVDNSYKGIVIQNGKKFVRK